MKITREADYALRIVETLAETGTQIDARKLSEGNDIPYRFTLKILHKLVHSDIIKSQRGVSGGYSLNKKPEEISLKDIIELIDGKIAINKCLEVSDVCKNNGICAIQRELLKVQQNLIQDLANVTFGDILKNISK